MLENQLEKYPVSLEEPTVDSMLNFYPIFYLILHIYTLESNFKFLYATEVKQATSLSLLSSYLKHYLLVLKTVIEYAKFNVAIPKECFID